MFYHFRQLFSLSPLLYINTTGGVMLEFSEELRQWSRISISEPNVPDITESSPVVCRYFGKLRNDKPTGYGILLIVPQTYSFTTVYRGKWKDGRFHGRGTLESEYSSHSRKYTGYFKDGLKHGYGKESWLGGDYKGLYENDQMCGQSVDW